MQMSDVSFLFMQSFLDRHLGLYYPIERKADLENNLSPIAANLGFKSLDEYISFVSAGNAPDALTELSIQLTIGETYFFREPKVLEYFKTKILPQLLLKTVETSQPVSVWSAGCSSGEELYSITMIIHNALENIKGFPVKLIGTDINSDFLEKASRGIYRNWSFRIEDKQLTDTYFTAGENNTFVLSDSIKQMAQFSKLNLISDDFSPLFEPTGKADVIFCRNVLIYFSDEGRKKIINKFYDVLHDGGYLILSLTEVAHQPDERFTQIIEDDIILFKKETNKQVSPVARLQQVQSAGKATSGTSASRQKTPTRELSNRSRPATKTVIKPATEPAKNDDFHKIETLYNKGNFAGVISLGENILANGNPADSYTDTQLIVIYARLIRSYASSGIIEKALSLSRRALGVFPNSARLSYIHGQLLVYNEQSSEARTFFTRALFLEPAYPAALFALAGLLRKNAELEDYKKLLQQLLKESKRIPDTNEIEEMDGLTAKGLQNLVESILKQSDNLKTNA